MSFGIGLGGLGLMSVRNPRGSSDAAETTAFLARTTGLDATHTNAYKAMINGLVSAGISTKDDFRQIPATQDQTTGNLNLWSTSYTATPNGSPTWAADVGYTTEAGKWIDTGFNLSTAAKYSRNNARISMWSGTATAGSFWSALGVDADSGSQSTRIFLRNGSDRATAYINSNDHISDVPSADASGLFIAQRTDATTIEIWRNAVLLGTITSNSSPVNNVNLITGGNFVTAANQYQGIFRSISGGAFLTPTEIAAEYQYMAAYMAAIGATP